MKKSVFILIALLCLLIGIILMRVSADEQASPRLRQVDHAGIQACRDFEQSAEQGSARNQYNTGVCYDKGEIGERDTVRAAQWFLRAAHNGFAPAQFNIADMYEKGQGVGQDQALAVYWYRQALDHGYLKAAYSLGLMYGRNQGVAPHPQNGRVALMLIEYALNHAQGRDKQELEHARAYQNRDKLRATLPAAAQIDLSLNVGKIVNQVQKNRKPSDVIDAIVPYTPPDDIP